MKIKDLFEDRAAERIEYMQGYCGVLAAALHFYDPKRFTIGFVHTYANGSPDLNYDQSDFDDEDEETQHDILNDTKYHFIHHAFVKDNLTGEWIDADGRHQDIMQHIDKIWPNTENELQKLVFPATVQQLAEVSMLETEDGAWNYSLEDLMKFKGQAYIEKNFVKDRFDRAVDYAKKYLKI